ncbi:MAG: MFS transporter [Rhodothalassiaceae bacterium]|nr:MAG: MFS transporter [Rhodothalassiaceae bacterium]
MNGRGGADAESGTAEAAQPLAGAAAEPWPRPAAAWGVVALLFLIYTLSFIDRQILALLVGPIKRDLQAGDFAFSLLSGFAFALFYTVFGLPFARYADRGSRTGLIAFGVALWSLATAACGLARGFWGLFGARVMVGVGEATLTPAANSLIADLFPPAKLGRALAVYSLGIPIGSAMAFILGGAVVHWVESLPPIVWPLVGELHGWQLAFIAVGLPGLVFALVMMALPEPRRRGPRLAAGRPGVPLGQVVRYVVRHAPAYAPLFFGAAMLSMLGYGATLWMIAFFERVHAVPAGDAGTIFGLILLVFGTGGILLGGTLADLWFARGRRDAHLMLLLFGTLAGLPFGIAYPLVDGLPPAIALLAVSTLISNMPWGLAYAAIATITPNELRGQMAALYLFIVNLIGLGIGPSVIAVFTDWVFADETMIGASMAAATAVIAPLAALLFALGRRPFARAVAARLDTPAS